MGKQDKLKKLNKKLKKLKAKKKKLQSKIKKVKRKKAKIKRLHHMIPNASIRRDAASQKSKPPEVKADSPPPNENKVKPKAADQS